MQKDIGNYIVHSDGKVWSKYKKNWMKLQIHNKGYYRLPINGRKTLLHRLLAETFIPNPNNLPQVNHKSGIKTDNRLENLEWCTGLENTHHAFTTGLQIKKLTKEQVKEIKESQLTCYGLSKIYNVNSNAIRKIKNNISWKHI
jgi:hypothetical protein